MAGYSWRSALPLRRKHNLCLHVHCLIVVLYTFRLSAVLSQLLDLITITISIIIYNYKGCIGVIRGPLLFAVILTCIFSPFFTGSNVKWSRLFAVLEYSRILAPLTSTYHIYQQSYFWSSFQQPTGMFQYVHRCLQPFWFIGIIVVQRGCAQGGC